MAFRITRAQRVALAMKWRQESLATRLTYRAFRRTVVLTVGCDNVIAVPWCGMWLCIEQDGYTHS